MKSDFIPGTDVLAVDKKETGRPFAPVPSNPDPDIVHSPKPGSLIPDDPTAYPSELASIPSTEPYT